MTMQRPGLKSYVILSHKKKKKALSLTIYKGLYNYFTGKRKRKEAMSL